MGNVSLEVPSIHPLLGIDAGGAVNHQAEFADFWALKWADVLRSSRKTIQVKGSYGMQAWLRGHFLKNTPMDKVVQEIITANGNTYTNPPANYYRALKDVAAWTPDDAIIIGEGASTMDIGRTQLFNSRPRHRLDAGSYGTMGIGMGFVVAAAVVHPDKPIISVSGDSAIGFSGMEMETVCRYQLPVKIVVFNNGGIGQV